LLFAAPRFRGGSVRGYRVSQELVVAKLSAPFSLGQRKLMRQVVHQQAYFSFEAVVKFPQMSGDPLQYFSPQLQAAHLVHQLAVENSDVGRLYLPFSMFVSQQSFINLPFLLILQ